MRAARFLLATALLTAPVPALAGWDEGVAAYQRKDWVEAAREFKLLADAGHTGAQTRLGQMMLHGQGVAKDEAGALKLLQTAAEKGDAVAQNALGRMYFLGIGTAKDPAQAVQWFVRAADQNLPSALNNLGQLYLFGNGVAKDEGKAIDMLRRAAEQGNTAATEALGMAYWDGRGVAADHAEAVRWLRKAAERGMSLAQNRLGGALWNGDGTAKNQTEAVQWFEKSGMLGNAASLNNAATAYDKGIGVAKNADKAALYAILAARLAGANDKPKFEQLRDRIRQGTPADVWTTAEDKAKSWTPRPAEGQRDDAPPSPAARAKINAGSGLVVNHDGAVLTNSHVVASCRAIRVSMEGQTAQAATIVARDAVNDLAVLKAPLQPGEIAHFRQDKDMRAGDGVVAIGYPLSSLLSREPNVTAGVISAMAGIRGDKRHYQITAPVQKGNSGGPLADMSGNVVGIISAKLDAMKIADRTGDLPQNVNFAIKAELARKFLTDNGITYDTASASQQLSPADVGDIVRKVTAFVECEN